MAKRATLGSLEQNQCSVCELVCLCVCVFTNGVLYSHGDSKFFAVAILLVADTRLAYDVFSAFVLSLEVADTCNRS